MPAPFFIAGCGRSGTTLLYRLLADHPALALTNEAGVADLLRMASALAAVPQMQPFEVVRGESATLHGYVGPRYVDLAARVVREHAIAALEAFYRELFAGRHYRWWGDKLPEPETVIALQEVYPELRAVVLLRDPRDVLCSVRSYGRRGAVAAANRFLAEATAQTVAPYWRNVYEGLCRYVHSAHVIRYEDLVADPVEHAAGILDWLDVDHGPEQRARMTAAAGDDAGHGTAGSAARSVGRWRGELTEEELAVFEREAGAAMRDFGYH